jgi:hypothetical protein
VARPTPADAPVTTTTSERWLFIDRLLPGNPSSYTKGAVSDPLVGTMHGR